MDPGVNVMQRSYLYLFLPAVVQRLHAVQVL